MVDSLLGRTKLGLQTGILGQLQQAGCGYRAPVVEKLTTSEARTRLMTNDDRMTIRSSDLEVPADQNPNGPPLLGLL